MVVGVQHLHVLYLLIHYAVYFFPYHAFFCNFWFAIFSSLLILILRIVTKILTTYEIIYAYIRHL